MKHEIFQTAAKAKNTQHLQEINEVIEPEHGKVIHILVEKKLPGPFPSPFARAGLKISENEINPFSSILNTEIKARVPQIYPNGPFTFNAPSNSNSQNLLVNGKESKKKECPFCGCFIERINGLTGDLV